MSRWVVHCKKEPYEVYIGRAVPRSGFKASIWGNPFLKISPASTGAEPK
jgi:hypothetical protein